MTKSKIQKILVRLSNSFGVSLIVLRDEQRNRKAQGEHKFKFALLSALCALNFVICRPISYAEELKPKASAELTGCVCAAGQDLKKAPVKEERLACLEELKKGYFKDNKYSEFAQVLQGLCPGDKEIDPARNYYLALTRYSQLKYLEEAKGWDEYFAKGNEYRDDVVNGTRNAISATTAKDPIHIYAGLLAYSFHKDQQDAFSESALNDLMASLLEYAQSGRDIQVIKEVADKLLSYDEKGKSKEVYKIYAQKLSASDIKDGALKEIAVSFYKEANLQLAENIYDIYIERISKSLSKEKLIQELIAIAKDFCYKDNSPKDMLYAESIFKKIEDLKGKEVFDEELMYLRGFNLEKARLFAQAKDIYVDFLKRFPKSNRSEMVTYKTGLIFVYTLRDLNSGRSYFEQLIRTEGPFSTYTLASLYQLGLFKEWEGDLPAAKGYYETIVEKSADIDAERLALAKERLKEIEENKPLDYNIKIGLDTALKEEFTKLDMSKAEIGASSYQPEKNKEVDIISSVSLGSSGCLQVELQYLWSGDLAGMNPNANQPGFKASYKSTGTKVVILVLISPTGVTERSVDLIDVR